MRPRRFLLVTTALTSATLVAACKKEPVREPPPGNPKGAVYDDAGPPLPPPANPKGSGYDEGLPSPKPLANAADGGSSDGRSSEGGSHDGGSAASKTNRNTGPVIPPPPANPKGPHYDSGMKKPTPVK